jgi:putative glutamine amidotransferase
MTTARRPLIGITGRRWTVPRVGGFPDNFAGVEIDLHVANFPECVAAAGGLPVELTRSADITDVVSRMDAVVLTGGADVDPSVYGDIAHPKTEGTERARDEFEIAVLRAAMDQGKPVLAICRGLQLVNVALGGTLIQHLEPTDGEHHAAWDLPVTQLVHAITTVDGSLARSVYGAEWRVNSLHHQACAQLGHGVVATGHAPDGVVECIEVSGRAVFAVQWHPELVAAQPDPAFTWLVQATRLT